MKYPKYQNYEILYAKYFQRKPEDLLRLAAPISGKNVLDICGGNGRASKAAIAMGAKECVLIDRELDMIPMDLDSRIRVENVDILMAFSSLSFLYEVAICQQGINYWFSEMSIESLHQALAPGGIFVFNTFNVKPPTIPLVKSYWWKGINYVEVSWLVGNRVHHVQVCEGLASHRTSFMWIPPKEFRRVLSQWFEVTENREGKTSIYKCVKK